MVGLRTIRCPIFRAAWKWSANLILIGGAIAGFSLVNDKSHTDEAVNANVAEFFVLRKYRGQGVGKAAARATFNSLPGSWRVGFRAATIQQKYSGRGS